MMKKQVLSLSLLALSVASLGSCNKSDEALSTSVATQQAQQPVGIELEASLEDMEVGNLFSEEIRAIKYDLTGDYKLPKVNFGAVNASASDVPVHLFFRNTRDNQTHYVLLKMSKVKSKTSLLREFGLIDMKGKLNSSNANHWYVKAFIGGYPEKVNVGGNWPEHNADIMNDGSANRMRFLMDATPDISSTTSNVSFTDNYYAQGKWKYAPRPLPMQTEWTKFTFSHLAANGAKNPQYRVNSGRLSFKPMGMLLRVRIENRGKEALRLNTFALHNIEENIDDNGQLSISYTPESTIFLNNVVYTFDKNLEITNNKVNDKTSRTFSTPNNGTLTYHWYNNGNNSKVVTIEPNTSRIVFAWLHHNELNTNVTKMVFRPTIYVGADGDYANYITKGTEKIAAPTLEIARTKFVDGKTYPIKIIIYSKENVTLSSELTFNNFTNGNTYIVGA